MKKPVHSLLIMLITGCSTIRHLTGYYIYYMGELVAVVQNMLHGSAYISSSIDRKLLPLVVNASAAILVYYDLEQVVPAYGEE